MIATLVICSLFISVAFVESRAPLTFVIPSKPYRNINFNSRLNSIGNFFAGVSGVTPSQLLEPSWKPELLRGTSLQDTDLECAYKASRDGWSAVDFHSKVDNRGSCLVVGLTRTGVIFGAFNPLGWMSTDDYGTSNAAFLWFVKGKKVVKCPVLQGGTFQCCCPQVQAILPSALASCRRIFTCFLRSFLTFLIYIVSHRKCCHL